MLKRLSQVTGLGRSKKISLLKTGGFPTGKYQVWDVLISGTTLLITLLSSLVACTQTPPTLVILADELRAPILEELVQPFETSHNVDVQIQMVDFDDLLDTFKATAETEEGPDILIGPHDWLGELVANDFIAPLEIDEQQRANFLPSATFGFTYDEKLYGIPYAVENVAFFRNTDLVPEAPETWYEVAQIAAQLEAEGKAKQGFVLHADAYHAYPLHTAFGGALFGWDSRGQYDPTNVRLDSEASIAAARWLEAMTQGGHLTGDMNWNTMHAMFESGDSAMLITGPWALERIRESGIPYAISHLPEETEESLPFVGIQGFMVNAHGAHSDLAESFLTDFVLTESVMDALFEAGLRPSAYLPTRQNIDDPDLATFAAVGSNGLPMPAIPEMSAVWDAWEGSIAHILKQEQSADEAYRNAADQIRAIIAETPPPPQSP